MSKQETRNIHQGRNRWNLQRSWCIYSSAMEIKQPFPLERLQDAIYKKIRCRPRAGSILRGVHEFYEKHNIPLITQEEPGNGLFIVNLDIDLRRKPYRAIIQQPRAIGGRPPKNCCRAPDYRKRYIRNSQRL